MHALVAHADAVGDRYGAELQGVSAAGMHALFGGLRKTVEAEVAGRDLVPRACNADLGLVPVGVAHADRTQHPARRQGLDSVGDGARAGLQVRRSGRFRHVTKCRTCAESARPPCTCSDRRDAGSAGALADDGGAGGHGARTGVADGSDRADDARDGEDAEKNKEDHDLAFRMLCEIGYVIIITLVLLKN